MKRFLILAALACAMPLAVSAEPTPHHPAAAKAVHKAAPGSVVSIKMPGDLTYDYKKGPGQQVAQTYCLTCHSSGYVSMQPPMDAAHWAKTVSKMRKAYGMQISDADAAKVSEYLGKEYGPEVH
ncbi:MAG: hypothetical protein NVS3B16_06630 [Vulcanimicrobiaceae bacterium]